MELEDASSKVTNAKGEMKHRPSNLKIRQTHEECHYETAIYLDGLPMIIGLGFTKEEADTDCLLKFKKLHESSKYKCIGL